MHLLMSLIGCIESLMSNIGLEEILKKSFAGVEKMPTGKKCPMNLRAQWMIADKLLRRKAASFSQYSDLKCFLKLYLETFNSKALGWKLNQTIFHLACLCQGWEGRGMTLHLAARKACFPTFMMKGITVMLGMAHITWATWKSNHKK